MTENKFNKEETIARCVPMSKLQSVISGKCPPGNLQGNPAKSGIFTYRVWGEFHPCLADDDDMERDIPLP